MNNTGRLWYRRIVLGVAATILLALIVHPVLNALIGTDDPAAELAKFEKAPIPDQENAARWLEAGAGAVVWSDEDKQVTGEANRPSYRQWGPDLEKRVRSVIENHRGAISTLNKAIGLDQSSYLIPYSRGNPSEVPDYVPLIWSARLLLVEARLGFGSCEPDDGFRAMATLERLASTLEDESTLIAVIIGAATERMLLTAAIETISSDSPCQISNADLNRLQATIPHTSMTEALRRTITVETGFGRLALANSDIPADEKAITDAQILDLRQHLLDLVDMPYSDSKAQLEKLGQGPVANDDHPARGVDIYRNVFGRAQSITAQRQLLRALIHLRRHSADHGSYPAKASDIHDLATPNPVTNEPIRYTRNTDGSVTLEIVGARELLETAIPFALDTLDPVTLPSP